MAFNDFITTELPLRPFTATDGAAGQTLVRSNNPLAPRELVWVTPTTGGSGQSAYDIAVTLGFVGTQAEWLASLKGADGVKGDTGATGATGATGDVGAKGDTGAAGVKGDTGNTGAAGSSAYDIAVLLGFTGTQSEWITSLKGEKGDTGATGATGVVDPTLLNNEITRATAAETLIQNNLTAAIAAEAAIRAAADNDLAGMIAAIPAGAKGDKGDTGAAGASAYQIAITLGYSGSEGQWLTSLVGAQGIKGDKGDTGNQGIQGDTGIQGIKGDQGLSAYQVAVNAGYVGTEIQWLLSLKGADGIDGTGSSVVYQTPLVGINPSTIEMVDALDLTYYSQAVWDVVLYNSTKRKRFTVASLYNPINNKLSYTTYGIIGENLLHAVNIGYDGVNNQLKLYIHNKDTAAFVASALRYPVKTN